MKETRSIHELLIILKERVLELRSNRDSRLMLKSGLCDVIHNLHYNHDVDYFEAKELTLYLYRHRPKIKRLNKVWKTKLFYFWTAYSIKPRLNWLTRHINKTKPE